MTMKFKLGEETFDLRIVARKPDLKVDIGGQLCDAHDVENDGAWMSILGGNQLVEGWRYVDGDRVYLHVNGRTHVVDYIDPIAAAEDKGDSGGALIAPMPGVVVDVHIRAGEDVSAGAAILTIESMKLQSTINAPRDGKIETIHVTQGDSFERDAILVSLHVNDDAE